MTQEDLALEAGLTPRYVSLLETCRHQPTLGTMGDIARCLNMPLADLMAETEAELTPGSQTGA